ncbi:MAG: endonuclease/exonuclease/phosphatase family protein [Rubricoccaceae bacterium]
MPPSSRPSPAVATPYLAELSAPRRPLVVPGEPSAAETAAVETFLVATYNVHRWAGVRGGRAFAPERALGVIGELEADVIALQEVLRPFDGDHHAPDPLREAAEALGFHLAFVVTRRHKRGLLGNAVLSRWPIAGALAIDLTFGRLERRAALATQLRLGAARVTIAATHLALVDRTRARQVRALLEHPYLAEGPAVLLGDMNAWRPTAAARDLERAFEAAHHNAAWPASFPSVRPVLALDRAYARGARLVGLRAHDTPAARRGSDHLPVLGRVLLNGFQGNGQSAHASSPPRPSLAAPGGR